MQRVFTTLEYNIPFHIVWLGGLTLVLIVYSFSVLFRHSQRNREILSRLLLALLVMPFAALAIYFSLISPWAQSPSKYIFPFFGLLLAPIYCVFLLQESDRPTSAYDFGVKFVYPSALFIGAVLIRDSLLRQPPPYAVSIPLPLSAAFASLWIPAIFASFGFIVWNRLENKDKRVFLSRTLFGFAVLANAGVLAGVGTFQSRVPYSTTYSYGQLGIREAASYVRDKTPADEAIISMKDVGFLAGRPYWESYDMLSSTQSADELLNKVKNGQVRYLVFTRYIGEDRLDGYPELERRIRSVADEEWHYENYIVFRAKR